MPNAAPKPCSICRKLVRDGSSRCEAHKVRAGSFADAQRGSRHKRGYGTDWDKTREVVKVRANGLCEPCLAVGIVHEGHECDHVISKAEWRRLHRSLAGVDALTNLQWMNRDCHARKTVIDRMRAAGSDVPAWQPPTPTAAIAGVDAGPGASPPAGPGRSQVAVALTSREGSHG